MTTTGLFPADVRASGNDGRGRSPRPDNINDRTYGKRQGRTKMEGAPKRVPVPTPMADGATRADRPARRRRDSRILRVEYPDWVNTIARTCTGEFVFVRQYRRGLDRTCFELCAGVRDPQDATPEAAARRELLEETGFGGGQWSELMVVSANPSTQTNLTHCFVATDVERISEQHLESTEDLTVHLLTPEQVRDLLLGDRIKQALHAAPLWRYFAENRLL